MAPKYPQGRCVYRRFSAQVRIAGIAGVVSILNVAPLFISLPKLNRTFHRYARRRRDGSFNDIRLDQSKPNQTAGDTVNDHFDMLIKELDARREEIYRTSTKPVVGRETGVVKFPNVEAPAKPDPKLIVIEKPPAAIMAEEMCLLDQFGTTLDSALAEREISMMAVCEIDNAFQRLRAAVQRPEYSNRATRREAFRQLCLKFKAALVSHRAETAAYNRGRGMA